MKIPTHQDIMSLHTVVSIDKHYPNLNTYKRHKNIKVDIGSNFNKCEVVKQEGEGVLNVLQLQSIFSFYIVCEKEGENLPTLINVSFATTRHNYYYSRYPKIAEKRDCILQEIQKFTKRVDFSEEKSLIDHISVIIKFAYEYIDEIEQLPKANRLNFIFNDFAIGKEYEHSDNIPSVVHLDNFSWLDNKFCEIQFIGRGLVGCNYYGRCVPVVLNGEKNIKIEFKGYIIHSSQAISYFNKGSDSCFISFIRCKFTESLSIYSGIHPDSNYRIFGVNKDMYTSYFIKLSFIQCEFLGKSVEISGEGLVEIRLCNFNGGFSIHGNNSNIYHDVLFKGNRFFKLVEMVDISFCKKFECDTCTFEEMLYFKDCSFNYFSLKQNYIKNILSLYNPCFAGFIMMDNAYVEKLQVNSLQFGGFVKETKDVDHEIIDKTTALSHFSYYKNIKTMLPRMNLQAVMNARQAYRQLKAHYSSIHDNVNMKKIDYLEKKLYIKELSFYKITSNNRNEGNKKSSYNVFSWSWTLLLEKLILRVSQGISEQYHNISRPIVILCLLSIFSAYYGNIYLLFSDFTNLIHDGKCKGVADVLSKYWNKNEFLYTIFPVSRTFLKLENTNYSSIEVFRVFSLGLSLYIWYSMFLYFKRWLP